MFLPAAGIRSSLRFQVEVASIEKAIQGVLVVLVPSPTAWAVGVALQGEVSRRKTSIRQDGLFSFCAVYSASL